MSGIIKRIYRIVRAGNPFRGSLDAGLSPLESLADASFTQTADAADAADGFSAAPETPPPYPASVLEDLSLFGLSPPADLADVRRARNREVKKYHPDRFGQNPEKAHTAKEILQILNTAYDRLATFFEERGHTD